MARRTLIVVGAGASNEAGMPTSNDLKGRIAQLLDIRFQEGYKRVSGDDHIYEALKNHARGNGPGNINDYLKACWHIRDAMPQVLSIDNFIHSQEGDERIVLCGKLAIVRAILEAEKQSKLRFREDDSQQRPNLKAVEDTWYIKFAQLLTTDCTLDQLRMRLSEITMVIFNYDRCFEHFLFNALRVTFNLPDNVAAELVSQVEIFHPYGSVGPLPWQTHQGAVVFGANPHPMTLVDVAGQINTFTEGTNVGESDIATIHQRVTEARMHVFLGFAYHNQNLELLTPKRPLRKETMEQAQYYGTALGFSNHDRNIVTQDLVNILEIGHRGMNIDLATTCAGLFDKYNRHFSRTIWSR